MWKRPKKALLGWASESTVEMNYLSRLNLLKWESHFSQSLEHTAGFEAHTVPRTQSQFVVE